MQRLLALAFTLLFLTAPIAARGPVIDAHGPVLDAHGPVLNAHGPVLGDFVAEKDMQAGLMQMLANFTIYMKNDFQPCVAPNSLDETCGCFRGENTMGNDERGVRPNADLSMICAFLVKYGKGHVTLPEDVTWAELEQMAMQSLVFAYSTHKANRLKTCKDNRYWGSTSVEDHAWESSLWAMSVAYSAFFQWDRLSERQRDYIYRMLKAECDYELQRDIPTGFAGDTKAEENGWEADILAATLGLFPNDPLAPQWFERLRDFAINSYSQREDATDTTVIDPDYNGKRICDLYHGQNLYDDYTLQNHDYFHTSYQNVVIQELGEAALALKLFQRDLYGSERWHTNALMHNNHKVMEEVLYWLALSDGELAMPNGNDWSLFLYDQITSYSTNACFLRDAHALMLENRAYQMIKARQETTTDGSWLLRPDVGARRMGVQAHRVMMTWLMHEVLSTASLSPTRWDDFNRQYAPAKVFSSQNIIRAATSDRFTCFSWSKGLKSYTGYISPTVPSASPLGSPSTSNLIVPFRANNTGNFIGWYEVEGKKTNATPVVEGNYDLQGNSYVMNGELQTNDGVLNNRFAIYSTPGNAVIYTDHIRANQSCTINKEKGGLMAISVDEFTKKSRILYTTDKQQQLDGTVLTSTNGPWVNIDNQLGIVTTGCKKIAFGDRTNNNSILTARLYTSYSDEPRTVQQGETVDDRTIIYYTNTDASTTARLQELITPLQVPEGWDGLIAFDPDSTAYLLLNNFSGKDSCTLSDIRTPLGHPVFHSDNVQDKPGAGHFTILPNHSIARPIRFFTDSNGLLATTDPTDACVAHFRPIHKRKATYTVRAVTANGVAEKTIKTKHSFTARIEDGTLTLSIR